MLGAEFLIFAVVLRVFAGLDYLRATLKGHAQPNPVTWFFWGLAPLIAFLGQIQSSIEPTAWMTLALSVGPLLIFIISLTKKGARWRVESFDILCGISAAIGIILWQVTSDPTMALLFSILADILGGVPTVRKAYLKPESEKALPYLLSVSSMVITLTTIHSWHLTNYIFPVYILLINALIYFLVATRIGKRQRSLTTHPYVADDRSNL